MPISELKTGKAGEEQDFVLPKPSLLIPILCMLVGAFGFGALTFVMSDIGHASGCAIASFLFLVAALYMSWQTRS